MVLILMVMVMLIDTISFGSGFVGGLRRYGRGEKSAVDDTVGAHTFGFTTIQ